jgi:hypothetical protein
MAERAALLPITLLQFVGRSDVMPFSVVSSEYLAKTQPLGDKDSCEGD